MEAWPGPALLLKTAYPAFPTQPQHHTIQPTQPTNSHLLKCTERISGPAENSLVYLVSSLSTTSSLDPFFLFITLLFNIVRLVLPGIEPGYIHLPQSKIIMYSFIGILLSCEKNENF
jgi:hypothetical protein